MPAAFQVEVTHQDGTAIVKMSGEARLDIERAAFQLDRVSVHHPKHIIVDVSELTYVSSLGMSLFVNLNRTAKKLSGTVTLIALQPFVREALTRACLLNLFQIQPDMASALAAMAQPPQE